LIPSRPIIATSACRRSLPATATTEAMPLSGKYTSLIDLFDDCNRCRNLSGTASRCGCRRARSAFDMALRTPLRCTLVSTCKTIAWSIVGGFNPIYGTHWKFDCGGVQAKFGFAWLALRIGGVPPDC